MSTTTKAKRKRVTPAMLNARWFRRTGAGHKMANGTWKPFGYPRLPKDYASAYQGWLRAMHTRQDYMAHPTPPRGWWEAGRAGTVKNFSHFPHHRFTERAIGKQVYIVPYHGKSKTLTENEKTELKTLSSMRSSLARAKHRVIKKPEGTSRHRLALLRAWHRKNEGRIDGLLMAIRAGISTPRRTPKARTPSRAGTPKRKSAAKGKKSPVVQYPGYVLEEV